MTGRETMDAVTQAYYAGRNSWFPGERIPTEIDAAFRNDPTLAASWKRGLRHVLSEERLNADAEWD
jgi:hypothetical protein